MLSLVSVFHQDIKLNKKFPNFNGFHVFSFDKTVERESSLLSSRTLSPATAIKQTLTLQVYFELRIYVRSCNC